VELPSDHQHAEKTDRMNVHSSARMTASGRALLVRRVREEGWTPAEAAEAFEISVRTVFKWLGRFDDEGPTGLLDRTSRPRRSPSQISREWQDAIVALRQFKMTGAQIAKQLRLLSKKHRTDPPQGRAC
jgi:transposase